MNPPVADTRTRLLEAATAEFAEFGLAGGRVDRIAANAGANKQLIYAYYDSKDALFEKVLSTRIAGLLSIVAFDARDIPGYAERLFDFYTANAPLLRLAAWSELERPGALNAVPEAIATAEAKVEAVRAAIAEGFVSDAIDPEGLIQAVLDLTAAAARRALDAVDSPTARSSLRRLVERIVRP